MDEASGLLSLQSVDLQLARAREALANPPEAKAYRTALKAERRVEAMLTDLRGRHKDLDMELAELDEEQALVKGAIEEVRQRGESDAANYRSLADVREQYASLAKKLEKSEFQSERAMEALIELEAEEAKAREALERCKLVAGRTGRALKTAVETSQGTVDEFTAEREAIVAGLPEATAQEYETASRRFDGLCVERLESRSPSVCRITLQPDAIKLIHRAGPVTRCPYCRRILVVDEAVD